MRNVVRCGILLLALFSGANCEQSFDRNPQYTEVNPGNEAVLYCRVRNRKGKCAWERNELPIGIYPGKYEWVGDPNTEDCSLRIINAQLDYDDGLWRCEVTASDFRTNDALRSKPARVIVRVAPNSPQVEYKLSQIQNGRNLTTKSKENTNVKCISRYGNPPAILRWFLGDDDITKFSTQTNQTEAENDKKWQAISNLEYTFYKKHAGQRLRCVAVHEAYDTRSREVQVRLDIEYPPEVRLLGQPEGDLEENVDTVKLRCAVDANPEANILWKREGDPDIFSFQESLEFRPLMRKHSGTYICEAKNKMGSSRPVSVNLDVKYPPTILDVYPKRLQTVSLFNYTSFRCEAEGNPPPNYQWLQRIPTPDLGPNGPVTIRGFNATMLIRNVTYDYQGDYVCTARNTIKDKQKEVQSDMITLNVVGKPEIQRYRSAREVVVELGADAELEVAFCCDPEPLSTNWMWGSLQLKAGEGKNKYVAESVIGDSRDDCYKAKLIVTKVTMADKRNYYLTVENEKGHDTYAVALRVKEPVSMTVVIGIVIACLFLLVIVVLLLIYAFRAEKWCFSQKGDFKPHDLESDIESTKSSMHNGKSHNGSMGGSVLGSTGGAIPPDALYSTPKKARLPDPEYENLKHRDENKNREKRREQPREIIYADLQLPKSSNNGSMRARPNAKPPQTQYAEIQFSNKDASNGTAERVDL